MYDEHLNKVTEKQAYEAIKTWYKKNTSLMDDIPFADGHGPESYSALSKKLIRMLPPANSATNLEMSYVFYEIMVGLLEWGKDYRNGEYTNRGYALRGLVLLGMDNYNKVDRIIKEEGAGRLSEFINRC